MKIALLNPYKNVAETESARRIAIAAAALGHQAVECHTAAEIHALAPDFVLSLAHQDPKLTPYPTYGVLTAPRSWYLLAPRFIRNILTYDGFFTISDTVKTWLDDLCTGVSKAAATGYYANTCFILDEPMAWPEQARLAYFGTNWDGHRFGDLFRRLSERPYMRIYGPRERWQYVKPAAVCGPTPFDGRSTLDTYRACGVGLCLHLPDFTADNLPSNRIFEIAASGALVISDTNPFVAGIFGDAVLYIDHTQTPDIIAGQIDEHMRWVAANPGEAQAKAARARRIFEESLALERLLPAVIEAHAVNKKAKGHEKFQSDWSAVSVDFIVLAGDSAEALRRTLLSIAGQTAGRVRAIIIAAEGDPAASIIAADMRERLAIRIIAQPAGPASARLAAGLAQVRSDFFGFLQAGDVLFPNHLHTLFAALLRAREHKRLQAGIAYSGHAEYSNGRMLPEKYEDPYKIPRAEPVRVGEHAPIDAQSFHDFRDGPLLGSWIAEADLLDPAMLVDAKLDILADLSLLHLLHNKSEIVFSYELTAALSADARPPAPPELREAERQRLLLRQQDRRPQSERLIVTEVQGIKPAWLSRSHIAGRAGAARGLAARILHYLAGFSSPFKPVLEYLLLSAEEKEIKIKELFYVRPEREPRPRLRQILARLNVWSRYS